MTFYSQEAKRERLNMTRVPLRFKLIFLGAVEVLLRDEIWIDQQRNVVVISCA
jgi:hypothetical protein